MSMSINNVISETLASAGLQRIKESGNGAKNVRESSSKTDRVELSKTAQDIQRYNDLARAEQEGIDDARMEQIKDRIREGFYSQREIVEETADAVVEALFGR